jgi:hypothetical protein
MRTVTKTLRDTSNALGSFHCPGWVERRRSGVILVESAETATFGRHLSDLVRNKANTGSQPEALVLSQNPDSLSAKDGPTSVSPARIIDLLRREELDLTRLQRIAGFVPGDDPAQFCADLAFIASKAQRAPQVVLLAHREVDSSFLDRMPVQRWKHADLRRSTQQPKGSNNMARSSKRTGVQKPDQLKTQLKDLVRQIHDEEDPHELTEYKKFVKCHVSVFSRAYLTAYLVKVLVENGSAIPAPRRNAGSNDKGSSRGEPRRRPEKPKSNGDSEGNVAPEDRQTLFVSVGKNRRVYPKDFVALFAELEGVEGDDIGQIKILDNYSFVEVDKGVADQIIGAYDGYEFRGRKLTVNYARSKKD